MKINVDSKNIYDFAEMMSFISHEYGLVGMDWQDVKGVFDCNNEMSFYIVEGDAPKDALTKWALMIDEEMERKSKEYADK